MDGQLLTMAEAWHTYDRLLEDDLVGLEAQLVTFDRALENRGAHCLVLR